MGSNPYLTIWFKTSKTIDNIFNKRIHFRYEIPILIASISNVFGSNTIEEFGFGLAGSIIIAIILIGPFYYINAIIYPWLILKTGKLLKGKSNLKDLQIIIGLANIPIIIILIYQLLSLSIGKYIGDTQVNYSFQLIVWIFFIRTLIIGISKAQKFSYGFAVVNIFLSTFLVILLVLLITLIK